MTKITAPVIKIATTFTGWPADENSAAKSIFSSPEAARAGVAKTSEMTAAVTTAAMREKMFTEYSCVVSVVSRMTSLFTV